MRIRQHYLNLESASATHISRDEQQRLEGPSLPRYWDGYELGSTVKGAARRTRLNLIYPSKDPLRAEFLSYARQDILNSKAKHPHSVDSVESMVSPT